MSTGAWFARGPAASADPAWPGLRVALGEGEACLYLPDAASPPVGLPAGFVAVRLALLQRLAGAAAGGGARWHYVVAPDVLPAPEDDFNDWYEREHLPGLAAVPGTVSAARYRVVDGAGPRYHACYELAGDETFGSPAWLAVRATPWSGRVRPAFVNTRRTMYRIVR